jgi:hypothetical protein
LTIVRVRVEERRHDHLLKLSAAIPIAITGQAAKIEISWITLAIDDMDLQDLQPLGLVW